MKYITKTKQLLLALLMGLITVSAVAGTYRYKADVEGMVCAFCAYSVAKNISKLPGVDSDSVNVDLKGGHVIFNSQQKVAEEKITELFSESGFSLSNLTFTQSSTRVKQSTGEIILDLKIDAFKTDQFSSVIEAIGNQVASTTSSLIITAPASQEETILKPLLMGRQQVVKVRFISADSDTMRIQLFSH